MLNDYEDQRLRGLASAEEVAEALGPRFRMVEQTAQVSVKVFAAPAAPSVTGRRVSLALRLIPSLEDHLDRAMDRLLGNVDPHELPRAGWKVLYRAATVRACGAWLTSWAHA